MLVNLVEVISHDRPSKHGLTENSQRFYTLEEIEVNPSHVVCLRQADNMKRTLSNGELPEGLSPDLDFTRVFIDRGQMGIDIIVVGSVGQIKQKLMVTKKKPLKG